MSSCSPFPGSNLTNSDISGLVIIDEIPIESTVKQVVSSHGKYKKNVNQDRFQTGKLESENGSAALVRKFEGEPPKLNESTVYVCMHLFSMNKNR